MIDLGNQIETKRRTAEFSLVGAIHHHPIPVERPDWQSVPFYERILGSRFDATERLEDAPAFLQFVREQGFSAVLHGHKHIPRVTTIPGTQIPVVGCGSSIGKIAAKDGTPYMSVNVLTVDRPNRRIAARLLASRAAGGRLSGAGQHEAVLVSDL
jgi:3',5'-cyclic AMP phosphodiesterase CpdA